MFRRVSLCLFISFFFVILPALAEDHTDVTTTVVAAVKDNKLSIAADNETFGDTVPGVVKKLHVEYTVGGAVQKREVPEGERMEIAAPAGQKLVIKKATYEAADAQGLDARRNDRVDSSVLETLPGFKVDEILQADRAKNGSWICMAKDPKGRLYLGAQRGQPITRVTLDGGKVASQELLQIPVSETMGMLFVDNVLYLNGWGKNDKLKSVFGLFRCTDTQNKGTYDKVEFLREWIGGWGEHGAHGMVLGPDKMLYAICGNFTALPTDFSSTSPHRNYADDVVLKRAEDGNGFGAGRKPPGGFVARMDLDAKNVELFASGQRNTYDIAFNPDGELFGFDSDMEWDWGTSWYRPIRVFHAVRGADHGYREGSAKWPEYYHDSLPATVNIGIGSPTGVVFGTGAKFPLKYQKAFYICEWSYGRLIAVHLKPDGGSYTATWENFVTPKGLHGNGRKTPLNLTDVLIGDDGALYFTVGGRDTHAGLFRVSYEGNEPSTPAMPPALHETQGADARALRRQLEAFNVKPDPTAVDFAWPHLSSPDRFIRYAARLAIERNPVEQWQSKALAEKNPDAALTALLALARLGPKEVQPKLLTVLMLFPFDTLTDAQKLEKLRVVQVSIARQGVPAEALAQQVITQVDPLFPSNNESIDREACQILLALNAPNAVAKTVAKLAQCKSQEEQTTYILHLRNMRTGWNNELRKTYLSWWNGNTRSKEHPAHVVKWFEDAGIKFNNGSSFQNFMAQFHEEAKFSMSADEIAALNDLLAAYNPNPGAKPKPAGPPRKLVKEWTTADLQPMLEQVGRGRNFNRGRDVFDAAQCRACHRYGDQGGAIGPDLTAVSSRFKRQDILESMTEPSKVISEQYMNTAIKTTEGKVVIGRIVEDNADTLVIRPNPLEPQTVKLNKAEIKTRELSKVSPMPEGLLNTFTKEEILDLLAFLESLGDSNRANFK